MMRGPRIGAHQNAGNCAGTSGAMSIATNGGGKDGMNGVGNEETIMAGKVKTIAVATADV
jgi:hypothetical protein